MLQVKRKSLRLKLSCKSKSYMLKGLIFLNFGQSLEYDEIEFECYKLILPINKGRNYKAYL